MLLHIAVGGRFFLSNKKVSEPLTVIGRDSDTEKRSVL